MARGEPNFIMMADEEEPSPVDQLRRRALRLLQAADETPNESKSRPHMGFAAPAAIAPAGPAPARALAVGVVTMPAVFIVVVMGSLALFGKPASGPRADVSDAAVATLEQPASRSAVSPTFASSKAAPAITLGEDRRVTSISLDGDRVALHVESPMGSEIVVYDYVDERIVAATPIVSAAIEADDELSQLTSAPPVASLAIVIPAADPAIETKAAAPEPPTIKPRTGD